MKIYSIYDSASELYGPPQVYNTDAMAIRAIQRMQQSNPSATEAQYPDQFTLFSLGEFDEHSAEITLESKRLVVNLASLKEAA